MSRFFAMLHAKNYYIRPMFHGVIHKITLAQFFLRHGVEFHELLYGTFNR